MTGLIVGCEYVCKTSSSSSPSFQSTGKLESLDYYELILMRTFRVWYHEQVCPLVKNMDSRLEPVILMSSFVFIWCGQVGGPGSFLESLVMATLVSLRHHMLSHKKKTMLAKRVHLELSIDISCTMWWYTFAEA